MKMLKKLLSLILACAMLLQCTQIVFAGNSTAADRSLYVNTRENTRYVAIGDSITAGISFNASDWDRIRHPSLNYHTPTAERRVYSEIIAEDLCGKDNISGENSLYSNLGLAGALTKDVYQIINGSDKENSYKVTSYYKFFECDRIRNKNGKYIYKSYDKLFQNEIAGADIITINLGGNDFIGSLGATTLLQALPAKGSFSDTIYSNDPSDYLPQSEYLDGKANRSLISTMSSVMLLGSLDNDKLAELKDNSPVIESMLYIMNNSESSDEIISGIISNVVDTYKKAYDEGDIDSIMCMTRTITSGEIRDLFFNIVDDLLGTSDEKNIKYIKELAQSGDYSGVRKKDAETESVYYSDIINRIYQLNPDAQIVLMGMCDAYGSGLALNEKLLSFDVNGNGEIGDEVTLSIPAVLQCILRTVVDKMDEVSGTRKTGNIKPVNINANSSLLIGSLSSRAVASIIKLALLLLNTNDAIKDITLEDIEKYVEIIRRDSTYDFTYFNDIMAVGTKDWSEFITYAINHLSYIDDMIDFIKDNGIEDIYASLSKTLQYLAFYTVLGRPMSDAADAMNEGLAVYSELYDIPLVLSDNLVSEIDMDPHYTKENNAIMAKNAIDVMHCSYTVSVKGCGSVYNGFTDGEKIDGGSSKTFDGICGNYIFACSERPLYAIVDGKKTSVSYDSSVGKCCLKLNITGDTEIQFVFAQIISGSSK